VSLFETRMALHEKCWSFCHDTGRALGENRQRVPPPATDGPIGRWHFAHGRCLLVQNHRKSEPTLVSEVTSRRRSPKFPL
jgi:hypothetical protein